MNHFNVRIESTERITMCIRTFGIFSEKTSFHFWRISWKISDFVPFVLTFREQKRNKRRRTEKRDEKAEEAQRKGRERRNRRTDIHMDLKAVSGRQYEIILLQKSG